MITNDKLKYFVLVRLFKGWEDQLELFGSCESVYRSMRIESNLMSYTEDGDELYQKWLSLHKSINLDSSLDVLIKKDLSEEDKLTIIKRLRTPIYSDPVTEEVSDDTKDLITDEESYYKVFFGVSDPREVVEPSYKEWMANFKAALSEFEKLELYSE